MKNITRRKKYDSDFKKNAVELVLTGHRTCRSVERDLDIGQGILHRWIEEYRANPQKSFPGNGRSRVLQDNEEVIALRREVEILKTERTILKKALAIFSTEHGKSTHLLVR